MNKIISKSNKYIVLKKTHQGLPSGHWTYIALIDRSKSKLHWWTVKLDDAMQFNLEIAAKAKAKSLKYGPFKVVPASDFDKFIGREFCHVKDHSPLYKEILRKKTEWHDDDWYEGINN